MDLDYPPARFQHVSCEFLVTGVCNLACGYCIAKDLPPMHMDDRIGRAAIDMFVRLAVGAKSIEVVFTGGEPLLNFRIVRSLASHASDVAQQHGMAVQFVLKTNGTVLTPKITEFLLRQNCKTVVSIDGDGATHDLQRRFNSGQTTYSIISKNIKTLLQSGVQCAGAFTVHPASVSTVLQGIKNLHALGIHQIDVGPAYGTVIWTEHDVAAFVKMLGDIALYVRDVNGCTPAFEVGPLYRRSEHVGNQLRGCWGCGAGLRQLAFLPDGRIAACSALAMLATRFPEFVLGHVNEGLYDDALDWNRAVA